MGRLRCGRCGGLMVSDRRGVVRCVACGCRFDVPPAHRRVRSFIKRF